MLSELNLLQPDAWLLEQPLCIPARLQLLLPPSTGFLLVSELVQELLVYPGIFVQFFVPARSIPVYPTPM